MPMPDSSRITKNFCIEEFKTPPDLRLVLMLQHARDISGQPINIQSNTVDTAGYYTTEKCEMTTLFPVTDFAPVYGKLFKHNTELFTLAKWNASEVNIKAAMIALAQCGFDEGVNNDNPFGKHFKMNNVPWCSLFLHWCWVVAGAIKHPTYLFASSRKSHEGLLIKKHISIASTGDGLFWGMNNDKSAGHTAMCLFNDYKNGMVYTIEGNSGNSVSVRKYSYANISNVQRTFIGAAAPLAFTKNENLLKNVVEFGKNEGTR